MAYGRAKRFVPTIPFTVPMQLLIPTTKKVKGVVTKTYTEGDKIFGSFRSFTGTETIENDVYAIKDTATIDTWYNPTITPECRVKVLDTDEVYDIISGIDDIYRRHQFMQFKVERVGANA